MWVIAGLGNPGSKYVNTRHNIGFKVIEQISKERNISLEKKDIYIIGKGVIEGEEIILLKPLLFMNKSGIAVNKILKQFNVEPDKLIVIHDDLDLAVGILKIKKNGSSGGHKGVESIIQETGTKNFIRIKIGIGRDSDIPVEKYVLSNFRSDEKDLINETIIKGAQAVFCIVKDNVDKAMNIFNRPKLNL